jgi:hypothetical protein
LDASPRFAATTGASSITVLASKFGSHDPTALHGLQTPVSNPESVPVNQLQQFMFLSISRILPSL